MGLEKLVRERTHHLCSRLQIKAPIIASPMLGVTTPAMVAAVSNAGGLGVLPCGFMTAEEIAQEVADILVKCMVSAGEPFCTRAHLGADVEVANYWVH